MNALQEKLLELLKEIDVICKKHNITYYIDGGSAIGAIRHKGFIPWDDDIDIAMTRENYNKFRKIIDKEIPSNRKFECMDNNPNYTMVYARYCDRETTSILRSSMLDVFESGVFIDIFILDPFPDDEKERRKYLKLFYAYAEYINPYYYDTIICENYKDVRKLAFLDKVLGRKRFNEYIEKKLFSYKEEDCKDYHFRFDLFNFIYPKEYFEEPRIMEFAGMQGPVPTMIEDYLDIHYGDTWMYIPDPDNQDVHNVVTNLNVPYQTFKEDYMKYISENAINIYKKFHKQRLKRHKYKNKLDILEYKNQSILYKEIILLGLEKHDIEDLYKNNKYNELEEIFKRYYILQLDGNFRKNNITIDIEDYLYIAIDVLIKVGRYYDASKILKLYPNKFKDLEEKVLVIRKLNQYYYRGKFDEYNEMIEKYYEDFSDNIDFVEGYIKLLIENKDYNKASKLIESSLKKYNKQDFLNKYKADIIYLENKKEAIKLYKEVINNTNNGLLIIEINNILGE